LPAHLCTLDVLEEWNAATDLCLHVVCDASRRLPVGVSVVLAPVVLLVQSLPVRARHLVPLLERIDVPEGFGERRTAKQVLQGFIYIWSAI
jgi:hypothetical protein